MAFRMQTSVPELIDLSSEPEAVFEMYGPDSRKPGTYAANCLLARRLAERGVRFIQLFHRGWDQHTHLPKQIAGQCRDTDKPRPPWSRTSSSAACSTTRWWSGAASSAGRSTARAFRPKLHRGRTLSSCDSISWEKVRARRSLSYRAMCRLSVGNGMKPVGPDRLVFGA